MDAHSTTESQHPYPSANPWVTTSTPTSSTSAAASPKSASVQPTDGSLDAASAAAAAAAAASTNPAATSPYQSSRVDFLPLFFPQQSSVYHAQLLHYNKLISPARGGGLQTSPLPPVVSASNAQAGSRSRSSSKVSVKEGGGGKGHATGGHGGRSHHHSDKNRSAITSKEASHKMPAKQHPESSRIMASRSAPSASSLGVSHSNSVPSTPHQHARQFSLESREPSPNAVNSHSPRSVYSETSSSLPSLRPLGRVVSCRFENSQVNMRRRIPYSVGNDRLEKLDLRTVKAKLTEDEEKKLSTDMREVFDRLLPTAAVEEKRTALVHKLEKIFNEEWPGHDIRVHLFGSSGNLLCSDDSDVDICITTTWHELEGVCMIADLLARRGMEKVVCISAAKVPIVKIWDPEIGLACDMNVNNTLALENTRMIRTYVEIDPRVRQLAMIIKHWTRRRVVNDAALGGTLSSYTWICLIIAFLQLRSPPVLPALHQLPYKMPKADGSQSSFADNIKRLKGYGNKNKSSVAELLFQFFRFYAHEFDYDKHVLSVRLGRLITKNEKKWNYGMNNTLGVEEPFNTSRNLGNTADEYSFRGLHMEIRRAFDLISEAKFEEACEQWEFPKEEEKVWSRPAPQSRPVLLRSSSQSHSGRGGRGNNRGGRHNNFRGGGSNRRASSSVPAYDPNVMMSHMGMAQDMSMFFSPHYQFQYVQQDLMTQMAYQENLRNMHYYGQSLLSPGQTPGQQQRMAGGSNSGQQSAGRSRTNSFDNPPLSAPPMQTDMFALYGIPMGQAMFPQAPTSFAPFVASTASSSVSGQEFRRPSRSTMMNDPGASASNSGIRSQSQPASRSQTGTYSASAYGRTGSQTPTNTGSYFLRNANGVVIPNFMPDDGDFDETPKGRTESPQQDEAMLTGYPPEDSLNPAPPLQQMPALPNGIAFGDIGSQGGQAPRRLSTEQLPQTLLDRRIRRASRSPSPMGHTRAFSTGSPSTPLSKEIKGTTARDPGRPLVVNGSGSKAGAKTGASAAANRPIVTEPAVDIAPIPPPALQYSGAWPPLNAPHMTMPDTQAAGQVPYAMAHPEAPPMIVNGSRGPLPPAPADDTSFRERMNALSLSANAASQPTRHRQTSRQPQNGAIAPLDLAIGDSMVSSRAVGPEMAHLSPVYETRTPSPTVVRKFETTGGPDNRLNARPFQAAAQRGARAQAQEATAEGSADSQGQDQKAQELATGATPHSSQSVAPRENGHVRAAKSESDGGWQKAGKGKKRAAANGIGSQRQGEQPPKNLSERKGG